MKIDRIELVEIALRLRRPFRTSTGSTRTRRILLVRLEGEGRTGWGECVAGEAPGYSSETVETAWHVLTQFILPELAGRAADEPGDFLAPVSWIRGHRMAKAAVEMAAWDLDAKCAGVPLARHVGGAVTAIPVGVSVGIQPTDRRLLEVVEEHLARGYRRIKVKIEPGRDVEMLGRLRDRLGTDARLMADANSAYSLDDLDRLRQLDDLGLMMIEQPLAHDDYRDHARLQEELQTSLCLDESLRSARDTELALELGSCRIVNVKPGRVGGVGPALEIHDLCRERGVPLWCGGMLESGIGRAHNLALATLPGFTLPGDISESARYWEHDIVEPEFRLRDGTLQVPDGAGIGVEPDLHRIRELTERKAVFR